MWRPVGLSSGPTKVRPSTLVTVCTYQVFSIWLPHTPRNILFNSAKPLMYSVYNYIVYIYRNFSDSQSPRILEKSQSAQKKKTLENPGKLRANYNFRRHTWLEVRRQKCSNFRRQNHEKFQFLETFPNRSWKLSLTRKILLLFIYIWKITPNRIFQILEHFWMNFF